MQLLASDIWSKYFGSSERNNDWWRDSAVLPFHFEKILLQFSSSKVFVFNLRKTLNVSFLFIITIMALWFYQFFFFCYLKADGVCTVYLGSRWLWIEGGNSSQVAVRSLGVVWKTQLISRFLPSRRWVPHSVAGSRNSLKLPPASRHPREVLNGWNSPHPGSKQGDSLLCPSIESI